MNKFSDDYWASRNQEMTTLLPNSQACSQVETYEDMFKEISRKLYGEISEANQSLHTPAAQIATGSIVHEVDSN